MFFVLKSRYRREKIELLGKIDKLRGRLDKLGRDKLEIQNETKKIEEENTTLKQKLKVRNGELRELKAKLDDVDIFSAIKQWQDHKDFVLSSLCQMVINRRLLKIKMKNKPIDNALVQKHFDQFKFTHDLLDEEVA